MENNPTLATLALIKKEAMRMKPILWSEDIYKHNRNISRHDTLNEIIAYIEKEEEKITG